MSTPWYRSTRLLALLLSFIFILGTGPAQALDTGDFDDNTGSIYFKFDYDRVLRTPVVITAHRWDGQAWVAIASVTGTTDLEFPVLPIGPYRLSIEDPRGWYLSGWYAAGRIVSSAEEASDVVVPARQWARPSIVMPGSSTLAGRITDAETGSPIQGVVVRAYGADGGLSYPPFTQEFVTGPDGTYRLVGLTPDSYRLVTNIDDYYAPGVPVTHVNSAWNRTDVHPAGESAEVTAGVDLLGYDIPLDKVGTVTGRVVRSSDGLPSFGTKVIVYNATIGDWSPGYGEAYTDAAGRFTVTGLESGAFTLAAWGNAAAGEISTSTVGISVAATSTDIGDVTTVVGSCISGSVTLNPTEYPTGGNIHVELYRLVDGAWQLVDTRTTYSLYSFTRLEPGTYRIGFTALNASARFWPGASTVDLADDIRLDDGEFFTANMDIWRYTQLSGTSTSAHDGSAILPVARLWSRNGDGTWAAVGSGGYPDYDTPWVLKGDFSGDYRLTLQDPTGFHVTRGWPIGSGVDEAIDLHLSQGELRSLDCTMQPNYSTFDVSIVEAGTSLPIPAATVSLTRWAPSLHMSIYEGMATTDASGVAHFDQLMPGNYTLTVVDAQTELHASRGYAGVQVAPGVANAQTVELTKRGTFVGTVIDSVDRTPVPGAIVQISGPYNGQASTVTCDEQGRYVSAPLDAGWYRAVVSDPSRLHHTLTTAERVWLVFASTTPWSFSIAPDTVAPATTANIVPSYEGSATILLSAVDDWSGVEGTWFRVDGQLSQEGTTTRIEGLGTHTLEYWSEDVAGNREATRTANFAIVAAGPTSMDEVAGQDRFATSAGVSENGFPEGADTILITTGRNWPDALGGAALAGIYGSPILLTERDGIPGDVRAEILRLGPARAIILGGSSVVGPAVESELTLLGVGTVERIGGADRYATARSIAARVSSKQPENERTALIATGINFPDALAASPLAAANGWPIYLVDPKSPPQTMVDLLMADGIDRAIVLGGERAVSPHVVVALESSLPNNVDRLAGTDRYETAVGISAFGIEHANLGWDGVGIATGESYPDALAGGVLCARRGTVMLLSHSDSLPETVEVELAGQRDWIARVSIFGGENAVSQNVRTRIAQVLK